MNTTTEQNELLKLALGRDIRAAYLTKEAGYEIKEIVTLWRNKKLYVWGVENNMHQWVAEDKIQTDLSNAESFVPERVEPWIAEMGRLGDDVMNACHKDDFLARRITRVQSIMWAL